MIFKLYKMQYLFLVFGLAAIALAPVHADNLTEVVQTSYGPVRGLEVSYEGTNYKSFRGIPYAAPPVGDLRFRPPQPPAKWTEVLNATNFGKMCFAHKATSSPNTSEDCLTLDVYTPTLSENASKSVMVSIHGGGFRGGDGTDKVTGPQYLMQHDIVIVSIEYRLGPIGFLATNSSDSSGNWGMKDQVAALRWVRENIRHFGGNPDDVTIYGESAGGASVHLHLFSPLTKGLFHKAIPVSGCALNGWVLKDATRQERYSRNLAKLLGAPEDVIADRAKRVEFLRRSGAKEMTDFANSVATDQERKDPLFSPFMFSPVIERGDTEGAYLTEDPRKMLAEGRHHRVPIMMGNNDLEGAAGKPPSPETMRNTEANVCQILPPPLKSRVLASFACPKVAKLMRDAYFEGKPFESSPLNYVYLFADLFFIRDINFSQKWHAMYSNETSPVYNYFFTFDGQWNLFKKMLKVTLPGAVHGDEMPYMFKPNGFNLPVLPPDSREVITQKRWTTMIANFVKYGNPTPEVSDLIPIKWEAATKDQQNTMVINDDLKIDNDVFKKRMDMWEGLYKKYGY